MNLAQIADLSLEARAALQNLKQAVSSENAREMIQLMILRLEDLPQTEDQDSSKLPRLFK